MYYKKFRSKNVKKQVFTSKNKCSQVKTSAVQVFAQKIYSKNK